MKMDKLMGISFSTNSKGEIVYTLHVTGEFGEYYNNGNSGRGSSGVRCESVYVGTYDCSSFKPGDSIEIIYGQGIKDKSGKVYSPIRRIDVVPAK